MSSTITVDVAVSKGEVHITTEQTIASYRDETILLFQFPIFLLPILFSGQLYPINILLQVAIFCSKDSYVAGYLTVTYA